LKVALPSDWHWRVERGDYRDCTNPVIRLWLASYRLPDSFARHEGPIVVPKNQVLLGIVSEPRKSSSAPWKRWHLSNAGLTSAHPVDGNRYRSEVSLPRSVAVDASAWLGSLPMPKSMLAVANTVLRSVRVNPRYGCG
jgi:hypothetical protein